MRRIREKRLKAGRRRRRVRAKIKGRSEPPRFSVFRSNRYIWAQIIDDAVGRTIASASDREMAAGKAKSRGAKRPPNRCQRAEGVGMTIAERAKAKGVSAVRFDRGGYRYHGIVRAVAEGARKGGLKL